MIQIANTDAERQETCEFFHTIFDDIDTNAVPLTAHDDIYRPLVLRYHDASTGQLVGAALTCRAQVAAGSVVFKKKGMPLPSANDYTAVLDKHSELDLIGVAPGARDQGIGSKMLKYLERRLISQGVRIWFGNVTQNLETDLLRRFYVSHGFTVLEHGQPLPPLLGRQWIPPSMSPPEYFFYKKLSRG